MKLSAASNSTTKRKRPPQVTCHCDAYAFPHRLRGGLCQHWIPVDPRNEPCAHYYRGWHYRPEKEEA